MPKSPYRSAAALSVAPQDDARAPREKPAMFVRLKRYNPKRGCVLRKYTHLPSGKRFEESLGWYKVDGELADKLRNVVQHHGDPDSVSAFDVCTEAEARAVDEAERKAVDRKDAESANDVTTATLTPVDERMQARAHTAREPRSMR